MRPLDVLKGFDAGSAPPAPRRFVGGATDDQLDPLAAWWREQQGGQPAPPRAVAAPLVTGPTTAASPAQTVADAQRTEAIMRAPFTPPGAYKSVPTDQSYTGQFAGLGAPQKAPPASPAPAPGFMGANASTGVPGAWQPPPGAAPIGEAQPGSQTSAGSTPDEREKLARQQMGLSLLQSGIGKLSSPYGQPQAYPSDERIKIAVQSAPPREQDRAIDSLRDSPTWRYDDDAQRELGVDGDRHWSPMAQDVESTPLGALAVRDTPDGKMIDRDKALGMSMALLGRLGERVSDLEGHGEHSEHDRALAEYHRGMLSDANRKEAIEAVGKPAVDAALSQLSKGGGDNPLAPLLDDANKRLAEYQRIYPDIEGRIAASGLRNEEPPPKHLLAQFTTGPEGQTQFRDSADEPLSIGTQEPSTRLSVNQSIPRWQWDSAAQNYDIDTANVGAEAKARENAAKAKELAAHHYDRGVQLTKAGDHAGAALAFDTAHALVPHDVAASEAAAARARASGG